MSGGSGIGTDNNKADALNRNYPAVPYSKTHFNTPCSITNFENRIMSRNCELSGLKDLNQVISHQIKLTFNVLQNYLSVAIN